MGTNDGNKNKSPKFVLRDRKQVEVFDRFLREYFKSQIQFTFGNISLLKAFDKCQKHPEGGRLFAALLDLEINLNLEFRELSIFGAEWNKHYTTKFFEGGGTVLDSKERFFSRMKAHQHTTAFVLRYRAIWDKLMGILILNYSPDNYEAFRKADSRKGKFKKLAKEIPELGEDFAKNTFEYLEQFDQIFRTPEVHWTGSLRKWSFLIGDPISNPQAELMNSWNILSSNIDQLVERLDIKFEKQNVKTELSYQI
jgi:hypothetical protein